MQSEIGVANLLETVLPKARIKSRLIDLVSYASDAGFYYLRPKAIVRPVSEQEIIALFHFSHTHKVPLTFRTAGTSLSGQAITDGVLVDLSQYWTNVNPENNGDQVRVQPGITGNLVNLQLRKFHRKIGPDPASINSAMIGGILSNNSSGMCCGVCNNSYHTTQYIRFILPNGKSYSTEENPDYERFEKECPEIYQKLAAQRNQILINPLLYNRIRDKYHTKNTVGYSVNAFIDHEHPLDILAHLLIGAEGTLGFIAEAVLKTIVDYPAKSTALLCFNNIFDACSAIVPLSDAGAEAVELMDRASIHSIEHLEGITEQIKTLPESAAVLLVEFQGNHQEELQEKISAFCKLSPGLKMIYTPQFTSDPKEQAFLWKIRKGMFPAVGAVRASGSTVILEDIAFPVAKLGNAILDLQALFKKHGYANAIIFGHAKDGNIHFVVTQILNTPSEIERYDRFLRDVIQLVVNEYDGTLKAEHGTGRNMAPFVETEWGSEVYQIMKDLKETIDPENLLNPGVIINHDANAHIKNLKTLYAVEEEVDKCMECGYCEHTCPSRDITLTPRRRIVVRRELAKLKKEGNTKEYKQLLREYQYDGLNTCAVDGLCAVACPVDINTGMLIKRLRKENHSDTANSIALFIAKHFRLTTDTVGFVLKAGCGVNKILGKNTLKNLTWGLRKMIPSFPVWMNQIIPSPGFEVYKGQRDKMLYKSEVVYFPSCISRVMGGSPENKKSIIDTFIKVSVAAGINFSIPQEINDTCCGQLFSSKGFNKAFVYTANETIDKIWRWTNHGLLPIVLDVTSCTYTLLNCRNVLTPENKEKFDQLTMLDSVEYLLEYILPNVHIARKKNSIVLHPVCSLQKIGIEDKFLQVAKKLAHEVEVPMRAGCCGMAGDRGFMFPELTKSATSYESNEVKKKAYDGYYSSAKTCEMNMSEAVGKNYESIVYLLDECI